MRKRILALAALGTAGLATAANAEDAAVERTLKQALMLDDLAKTVVVLVTEHYVHDPSTLSAATASKALFAEMQKKGHFEGRLLGFTDTLMNPTENTPKNDFEKTAKEKLMAGEEYYYNTVVDGGRRYLQVATQVPVVMEKCVMCHANFEGKEGPIGALSYKLPIIQ